MGKFLKIRMVTLALKKKKKKKGLFLRKETTNIRVKITARLKIMQVTKLKLTFLLSLNSPSFFLTLCHWDSC